jgi:ABC-type sulfate transport system permease component
VLLLLLLVLVLLLLQQEREGNTRIQTSVGRMQASSVLAAAGAHPLFAAAAAAVATGARGRRAYPGKRGLHMHTRSNASVLLPVLTLCLLLVLLLLLLLLLLLRQEREGDARIQASVGRMQAVIEAGRAIREKNNRPLKQPLRRVVVVHPDPDFLADITGGLLLCGVLT